MKFLNTAIKGAFPFFKGRACRREYVFFNFLMLWLFCIASFTALFNIPRLTIILLAVIIIFSLICSLSAAVKRLHDLGKPFWYIFLTLIPIVGIVILINMLWFKKGQNEDNKYGESHNFNYPNEGVIAMTFSSLITLVFMFFCFIALIASIPDDYMNNDDRKLSDIMNQHVLESFEEQFQNDDREDKTEY